MTNVEAQAAGRHEQQEHKQQAHRTKCKHTWQPDRRNMKRADLSHMKINSRQTGQCGKETAAREKTFDKNKQQEVFNNMADSQGRLSESNTRSTSSRHKR